MKLPMSRILIIADKVNLPITHAWQTNLNDKLIDDGFTNATRDITAIKIEGERSLSLVDSFLEQTDFDIINFKRETFKTRKKFYNSILEYLTVTPEYRVYRLYNNIQKEVPNDLLKLIGNKGIKVTTIEMFPMLIKNRISRTPHNILVLAKS